MLSPQQSMKNAAFEVKEKLSKNKENLVDQVFDCDLSCDGSWQKRRYSSKNGTVSAISKDNGKVLDSTVLAKNCKACNYYWGKKRHRNMNSSYGLNGICRCC